MNGKANSGHDEEVGKYVIPTDKAGCKKLAWNKY